MFLRDGVGTVPYGGIERRIVGTGFPDSPTA